MDALAYSQYSVLLRRKYCLLSMLAACAMSEPWASPCTSVQPLSKCSAVLNTGFGALCRLSGGRHQVHTGVALVLPMVPGELSWCASALPT